MRLPFGRNQIGKQVESVLYREFNPILKDVSYQAVITAENVGFP